MKVRFVFYRASKERWNIVGHLIALYTALIPINWGRNWKYWFSHVEIWWPDEDGTFDMVQSHFKGSDVFFRQKNGYLGECFSSTTRGNAKGVRIAPASEVLEHPKRWKYIECEVDKSLSHSLYYTQIPVVMGKKYDYLGLFGFFLPWNVQDSSKWFCSELCAFCAWYLELLKYRHSRISPRRLASKLTKLYGEPKGVK